MSRRRARAAAAKPPRVATAAPPAQSGIHGFGLGLALVALAIVFYLPALRAGYVWDDGILTENAWIASPSGLWTFWASPSRNAHESHYWPLTYSTFWLEYRLWGQHPLGYHLDNILLHALVVFLLWRLLRRLDLPGAWLGAALFAVHPVHVESVAWIAERKDVLSGALYLGAALAYLEFHASRRRAAYGLALALYALALLSKSIVVTLPAALTLVLWWKRGRLALRDLLPLGPFVALGVALSAFDLWLFYERSTSTDLALTLAERTQIAGRALWFYLLKLLWPCPLVTLYPKWTLRLASPWAWLPWASALGLGVVLWRSRRRLGWGPWMALAYYAVTIAPALGLVKHGFMVFAWVADRFLYLASIGPLALIAAACARRPHGAALRALRHVLPAVLLMTLGTLTWRQAGHYVDYVTLFRHNTAVYPEVWQARAQLGVALAKAGRLPEAVAQYSKIVRQNPDERHGFFLELAVSQVQLGRTDDARRSFEAALTDKPDYWQGHYEFARFLVQQGLALEATDHFERALRLRPEYPEALNGLGNLLLSRDRLGEAIPYLRRSVELWPVNAAYRVDLGSALWRAGADGEATRELEEALRLDPESRDARAILGRIQEQPGRAGDAGGDKAGRRH